MRARYFSMSTRMSTAHAPMPWDSRAAWAAPATCTSSAPARPKATPRLNERDSSSKTCASGSSEVACTESLPYRNRRCRTSGLRCNRSDAERDLGDTCLLEKIEHVDDALMLHGAVGADDGANIGALRVGVAREREEGVVGGDLLLIDADLAVGIKLDREDDLDLAARCGLGQIEGHRLRHHHLGHHHEDDEQDQGDVDEGRDVDADDTLVIAQLTARHQLAPPSAAGSAFK